MRKKHEKQVLEQKRKEGDKKFRLQDLASLARENALEKQDEEKRFLEEWENNLATLPLQAKHENTQETLNFTQEKDKVLEENLRYEEKELDHTLDTHIEEHFGSKEKETFSTEKTAPPFYEKSAFLPEDLGEELSFFSDGTPLDKPLTHYVHQEEQEVQQAGEKHFQQGEEFEAWAVKNLEAEGKKREPITSRVHARIDTEVKTAGNLEKNIVVSTPTVKHMTQGEFPSSVEKGKQENTEKNTPTSLVEEATDIQGTSATEEDNPAVPTSMASSFLDLGALRKKVQDEDKGENLSQDAKWKEASFPSSTASAFSTLIEELEQEESKEKDVFALDEMDVLQEVRPVRESGEAQEKKNAGLPSSLPYNEKMKAERNLQFSQLGKEEKATLATSPEVRKVRKTWWRGVHDFFLAFRAFSAYDPDTQSPNQIKEAQLNQSLEVDRKKTRWKRRKKRFIRRVWGQIALPPRYRNLLLGLSILLFLFALVLLLPMFQVKEIIVEGNQKLATEELLQVSHLKVGQNMLSGLGGSLEEWLRLRYGKAEERLLENLYEVESVRIYPQLPSKIIMEIKERVPIAYLEMAEGYAQIDQQGVVMNISEEAPTFAPVIIGSRSEVLRLGKTISPTLKRQIGRAILLYARLIESDEAAKDGTEIASTIKTIRLVDQDKQLLEMTHPAHTATPYLYVLFESSRPLEEEVNWLRYSMRLGIFDKLNNGLIVLNDKYRVFLPLKNILPYERRDLILDELEFMNNPFYLPDTTKPEENTKTGSGEGEEARDKPQTSDEGNSSIN